MQVAVEVVVGEVNLKMVWEALEGVARLAILVLLELLIEVVAVVLVEQMVMPEQVGQEAQELLFLDIQTQEQSQLAQV